MPDADAELGAYLRAEQVANDYHPDRDRLLEATLLRDAAALLRTGPETAPVAADACARLLDEVARARHEGHPMSHELATAADDVARHIIGSPP